MSFLLDPFLAFMLGLGFSFLSKGLRLSKKTSFTISAITISLATLYSILLYLNWIKTDFLILDTFAKFLPIEQQFGPRIMFHSNATDVTKEFFPPSVVVLFYALYFLWFYLGFKSARQIIAPNEPTPLGNPSMALYIRIGGLLVFVSAGMMLFFFIMIPLDEVVIGDTFGAKSGEQDKEAAVKGYMAKSNVRFSHFSDELCNPDRLGKEKEPQVQLDRDSQMALLANELPGVIVDDLRTMCQSREDVGENIIFFLTNLSTWMFLIATFMVTRPRMQKDEIWEYGGKEES